ARRFRLGWLEISAGDQSMPKPWRKNLLDAAAHNQKDAGNITNQCGRSPIIAGANSSMSDSRFIFGDRPLKEWIDRYEQSHKHPINRTLHTLGIPMIAISLPLFLVAPLIRGFWKIPLSLFTLGLVFQFAGHAVEGKSPEFFKDWRFLFVGVRWWLNKIKGRA
ncbi:MAG TPA: DUF962 domain-containing protein, partial [Chthoniobacterales bacterium]|nr:DUF962 domain-containing protein [Chthoniobacterales bacterium]